MMFFFKFFRINCNVVGYLGKYFIYVLVNVLEFVGLIDLLIMVLIDFWLYFLIVVCIIELIMLRSVVWSVCLLLRDVSVNSDLFMFLGVWCINKIFVVLFLWKMCDNIMEL